MFRVFVLVHRYLGIAVGLIVLLWCVSGFVMMYVQYPELNEEEYLAGLPTIDTAKCCNVDADVLEQLNDVDEITIEMLAGQTALRARFGHDISAIVNLESGSWFSTISRETAMQQADAFLAASGTGSRSRFLERRVRDQWTVAGNYDAYRPLFLFAANDEAGTRIYVSGVNGQVVQTTSSSERFWNHFGAVMHWVYLTALRQNTALWSQVVIWLSIAGLFLAIVGLWLGIRQFGTRTDGSMSPYRWLFLGLHRGDLTASMRRWPLRELVLLPLLTGVTAIAISGIWMGYRRITR